MPLRRAELGAALTHRAYAFPGADRCGALRAAPACYAEPRVFQGLALFGATITAGLASPGTMMAANSSLEAPSRRGLRKSIPSRA